MPTPLHTISPSDRPPSDRPRSDRTVRRSRHTPRLRAALALLALGAVVLLGAPSGGAARTDVAAAQQDLDSAREARAEAEQRLADLQAEHAAVLAEIEGFDAADAQVTQDIAAARKAVREYAVAAYIDGGQGALVEATLDPQERATVAWRSQLLGGQAVSATEAVDRFTALKDANDPERVAAAARLDVITSQVEAASTDAMQAAGFERDAEHALAAAQASQASAEASAAQRRAEEKAAAAASAAAARTDATSSAPSRSSQGPAAPAAPAAPAPVPAAPAPAPAAPAPSAGASGNPTPDESAALARIRHCESRGNYSIVSSSGRYRGAYQFDYRTWQAVGGSGDPAAASAAEQNYRALLLYRQRGGRPWPNCG